MIQWAFDYSDQPSFASYSALTCTITFNTRPVHYENVSPQVEEQSEDSHGQRFLRINMTFVKEKKIIPIRNGLAYLDMHPYNKKEWELCQHVNIRNAAEWYPSLNNG